jgi:Uncharacterized protein conserved in bacteria
MDLVFEWDEGKNSANREKHGVSFEEARSAFLDENARVLPDPEHSEEEDRFILLGLGASGRMLIVCHCHREEESIVRIISARKANRREQHSYRWWIR